MNSEASVIALSEDSNIYMVVDELGRTIGTGTREVCEVLAKLTIKPLSPANTPRRSSSISKENIRSAITI